VPPVEWEEVETELRIDSMKDDRQTQNAASEGTSESHCSACAKWTQDNFLLSNALGSAIWYIREMHAKGFLSSGQPFINDLETIHRKNGTGGGI